MTKSGHKIIFTEDESIVITDKSGNEIHLDTTGSNINITAPETMTLNCKNMNINVAENMTTSVGMNISETAGQNKSEAIGINHTITAGGMMLQNATLDYTLMAANIMEVAQGDRKSEATQIKEIAGGIDKQSTNKNVIIQGKGRVITNSGEINTSH